MLIETAEEFIKRKNKEYLEKEKLISVKDVGRKGKILFKREAWVFMPQHNLPQKVFIFERFRREKVIGKTAYNLISNAEIEYRIGYYIIGKIGNKNGRWTWGQYCPIIPLQDFQKLISLAKRRGVLL